MSDERPKEKPYDVWKRRMEDDWLNEKYGDGSDEFLNEDVRGVLRRRHSRKKRPWFEELDNIEKEVIDNFVKNEREKKK